MSPFPTLFLTVIQLITLGKLVTKSFISLYKYLSLSVFTYTQKYTSKKQKNVEKSSYINIGARNHKIKIKFNNFAQVKILQIALWVKIKILTRFRNKICNALEILAKCLLWFDIRQDKSLLYMDHLQVQKRLSTI